MYLRLTKQFFEKIDVFCGVEKTCFGQIFGPYLDPKCQEAPSVWAINIFIRQNFARNFLNPIRHHIAFQKVKMCLKIVFICVGSHKTLFCSEIQNGA